MYVIEETEFYKKRVKAFLNVHPTLKEKYEKTINWLTIDPFHPSLRLHKFRAKGITAYSVSINLSYRIALDVKIEGNKIILLNIGDHKEIYGKG